MADTPKHSVSVAGVVVDDRDRVLIVRRRDNAHWEPPGGILELNEGPADGACREVLEETGLVVEVERLSGVYKNMNRGIVSIVFRCHPVRGVARTTIESSSVEWVNLHDAVDRMDEAYAVRVSDAFLEDPIVRLHNGVTLLDGSTAGERPKIH